MVDKEIDGENGEKAQSQSEPFSHGTELRRWVRRVRKTPPTRASFTDRNLFHVPCPRVRIAPRMRLLRAARPWSACSGCSGGDSDAGRGMCPVRKVSEPMRNRRGSPWRPKRSGRGCKPHPAPGKALG